MNINLYFKWDQQLLGQTLTQHHSLSISFNRNGLEEKDIMMLKMAFDNIDENNQGSLPLSKLINIVVPAYGEAIPDNVKCHILLR